MTGIGWGANGRSAYAPGVFGYALWDSGAAAFAAAQPPLLGNHAGV